MKWYQKYILLVLLLFAAFIGLYIWENSSGFYEEDREFKISIGETFTIKLYENGSTGYSNCWINENKSRLVKKVGEKYNRSWAAIFGPNGAGGSVKWTFKALRKGTDTIRINTCPTGRMGKECSYFLLDSLGFDGREELIGQHMSPNWKALEIVVNIED